MRKIISKFCFFIEDLIDCGAQVLWDFLDGSNG